MVGFNIIAGERADVFSAGAELNGVHPIAIHVMDEVGIDISHHTSDHVDRYLADDFDLVLTVCDSARESCPRLSRRRADAASVTSSIQIFPDLSEAELTEVFRRLRDEIGEFARDLLRTELG